MTPSPMNCAEEPEPMVNRRRYQRYEIDTQLHVTIVGVEQRGNRWRIRCRVGCWYTGPSRILSARYEEPSQG